MSEKQVDGSAGEDAVGGSTPISLSGKERNEAFASDFTLTVGGLSSQINAIVRRVLDGRVLRPADEDDNVGDQGDSTSAQLSLASIEAEELALLGLTPVRGKLECVLLTFARFIESTRRTILVKCVGTCLLHFCPIPCFFVVLYRSAAVWSTRYVFIVIQERHPLYQNVRCLPQL
jgi:hypothetical protein